MNFTNRCLVLALIGGLVWFCAATPASAATGASETVLVFARQQNSTELSLSSIDLATYGDRVTAPTVGTSSFIYGGVTNTPNIVVDFGSDETTWPTSYGDLTKVLYTNTDAVITILFTADPGYNVLLNSFDLAGYFGVDYTAKSVKVFGSSNQLLYNQLNVLAHGDSVGPLHTSLAFSGLQSQSLRIEIDLSNITSAFGAENVAVDNISFSQVTAVPEPTTYGAGLLVVGAFYLARRAKRARML